MPSTVPPPIGSVGFTANSQGTLVPAVDKDSNLSRADGGKRTSELRDRVMTSMALRDWRKGVPHSMYINGAASLSGPKTVEVAGANFFQQPSNDGLQAPASREILINGADKIIVYALTPGRLGNNIEITVNAPTGTGAVAVDSDEATDTPKVAITPKTGDAATTVTQINSSKLVRAELVGAALTYAAEPAAKLAGGKGTGVRLYLGTKLMYDTTEAGALFVGSANGTRISHFEDSFMKLEIAETDLVPGEAIPAGMTAFTAGESSVDAIVEWPNPTFQLPIPLPVIA